ncbi:OLC1v1024601C1 [Oldenlandia corymbosa var. corymbosa]|uniref:OLC1v1024601C1 n=1 Tax=Oldenlandia corymbosa var. corymbosa TaxID=529605 RepID=A0AAV1C368_OLDCO|nr:OLC1v1024601C1 [Oldenlandia corymbosa var. corymbosa]
MDPKEVAEIPTSAGKIVRSERKRRASEHEGSSNRIHLKIFGHDGVLSTYRIRRDKPMQKFLKRYCQDQNLEYLATDFLYEGERLRKLSTPDELRLEDGDQIEAFVRADGGGHKAV